MRPPSGSLCPKNGLPWGVNIMPADGVANGRAVEAPERCARSHWSAPAVSPRWETAGCLVRVTGCATAAGPTFDVAPGERGGLTAAQVATTAQSAACRPLHRVAVTRWLEGGWQVEHGCGHGDFQRVWEKYWMLASIITHRTKVRKQSLCPSFSGLRRAETPSPEMGCFTLTMNCRIALAATDH